MQTLQHRKAYEKRQHQDMTLQCEFNDEMRLTLLISVQELNDGSSSDVTPVISLSYHCVNVDAPFLPVNIRGSVCIRFLHINNSKVVPYFYSTLSIELGSDPGLETVSSQVILIINTVVGCHYFPPGLQLPSQLQGITALRPVPNYTVW